MDDDRKNKLIKIGESNNILKSYVLKMDKYIKSFPLKKLIYPKFRYYESRYNKNNSKYAYVTIIFAGESFLPGIFALGHSLRKVNSKYKLICMVQDKNEYNLNRITKDQIDDINKIYDLVIGVDIIKIECRSKYFLEKEIYYKNIKYYATKNNVLGLIEYEKIIYLDASCIVNKNIDNIFKTYHKSTYGISNNYEWALTNHMALRGNFLFIIPSIYNYNKLLTFIKEYDEQIGKYYMPYSIDEVMFYYSVYPYWANNPDKMFNSNIIDMSYKKSIHINKDLYYDYEKLKNNSYVYSYVVVKPFRSITEQLYTNSDLENLTLINYKPFDDTVKSLISEKPEMLKYFEFIKTFRVVFF